MNRRDFLTGLFRPREAALAATGGLVWSWAVARPEAAERACRPPAARPTDAFLATCIKCGDCVEACPFDTLKLATADGDRGIGTPYFEPREVPCYMCPDVPCVRACPTDALEEGVAIEDARMGLAVLSDQETCLAFQGLRCEVCYRACPLMGRAISLEYRPQERTGKHAFFLPVVSSEHCTGCGACEHACVLEESAIRVLPRERVQGRLGAGYRFGWKEEPAITRDFQAPDGPPAIPAWEDNLERVLEQLDELPGGEPR